MPKINFLNPFDKGFFGSTLLKAKPLPKNYTPSTFKHDSIDDLNLYFHQQLLSSMRHQSKKVAAANSDNENIITGIMKPGTFFSELC